MPAEKLSDILKTIIGETDHNGDNLLLGDVVHALEDRGFGPLLLAPALLVILPTGAIPGVPALCAIVICLVAVQITAGRHHPWLPRMIENYSFKRTRLVSAMNRAAPFAKRIDQFIHPRFEFFTSEFIQRFFAGYCFLLGLVMFAIGFIPLVPALLALPILFFSIGVSARDGLMILCGMLLGAGSAMAAIYLGVRHL